MHLRDEVLLVQPNVRAGFLSGFRPDPLPILARHYIMIHIFTKSDGAEPH